MTVLMKQSVLFYLETSFYYWWTSCFIL